MSILELQRAAPNAPAVEKSTPNAQPEGEIIEFVEANSNKQPRIGVELEFTGLAAPEASEVVVRVFGGRARDLERHQATVDTEFGRFDVVLDTRHAQKCEDDGEAVAKARSWFGDVASLVMPVEIACPPVPASRLIEIERLVRALRAAGAEGTNASVFYAFGTHLNVEIISPNADELLRTLRAYLLLEEWLRAMIDVNPSRSAMGFEARFPLEYERLVLDRHYAPDTHAFLADYVRFNPTRNRGLDFLPALASLAPETVAEALPGQKVSARPAYHYRLPNSQVDERGWSVSGELARWRHVEHLAADPVRLKSAAASRLALLEPVLAKWTNASSLADASIALGQALAEGDAI